MFTALRLVYSFDPESVLCCRLDPFCSLMLGLSRRDGKPFCRSVNKFEETLINFHLLKLLIFFYIPYFFIYCTVCTICTVIFCQWIWMNIVQANGNPLKRKQCCFFPPIRATPAHRAESLFTNESQGYGDAACSQNIRIPSWTHFLADMDRCHWKCRVVTF